MSIWELFLFFFKISAVTFGGGLVILGIIEIEQEKRQDIAPEKFTDMISLAGSMPGPIAVSIAFLLGDYYQGRKGAIVSVLGVILPPFCIILVLSPFIIKYAHMPAVQGFFKGVLAATAALITMTVTKNVTNTLKTNLWNLIPFILVIAMIGLFNIHPLVAMIIAFAINIAREKVGGR